MKNAFDDHLGRMDTSKKIFEVEGMSTCDSKIETKREIFNEN